MKHNIIGMLFTGKSVLNYFNRKRTTTVLISMCVLSIFVIFLYKQYLHSKTLNHQVFPILPISERRLRRGGDKIFDKTKKEKLPVLELNAIIPNEVSDSDSRRKMEFDFFNYVEHISVICHESRRLGTQHEGGWTGCISPPFDFKQPCLVYSFGIGGDWRFEDEMADMYHCQVMAFDPSMNKTEHKRTEEIWFRPIGLGTSYSNETKWPVKTFQQFLADDKNTNAVIDYLKFDIEFMEWEVIQDMLKGRNSLQNVKQIVFEMHMRNPLVEPAKHITTKDFIDKYRILKLIEKAGFRKFGYRVNPFCYYRSGITGEQRSTCYDLFYLNMRFVHDQHLRKGKGNDKLNLA